MPQFDQSSFLNQVFWFFLVFLNIYFFITFFFLPLICKNLKFRKKKIFLNKQKLQEVYLENYNSTFFLNKIVIDFSNFYSKLIQDINLKTVYNIKPLKVNILKNFTFQKNLSNFCINILSYPKNFN